MAVYVMGSEHTTPCNAKPRTPGCQGEEPSNSSQAAAEAGKTAAKAATKGNKK